MNSRLFRRSQLALLLLMLAAITGLSASVAPPTAGSDAALATLRLPPAGVLVQSTATPVDLTPDLAFEALQSRASGPLSVHWSEDTGIPDFLTGSDPATHIPYVPTAAERGNPVAIALGFFDENRALFGLRSAAEELLLLRVEPDEQLGNTHVRLAQLYQGIPVFGRQLIVHLDQQEQITAINGQFVPAINIATTPTLSQEKAAEVALDDLLQVQLEPAERVTAKPQVLTDKTQLMIYVDTDGRATLTWKLTIMLETPLGEWQYFVNARRPAIVHRYDGVEPIKRRITYTARNTTNIPGYKLIDEGERSKDEIAQAAHDSAGVVYDYYYGTFKRDAIDGSGGAMVSTVHYGSDAADQENAAWVGEAEQMIYGDGGQIFRPLAYGLDVVGHEFTHGIIDSTSQLVYEGQSGALNESYADVFGTMIDRDNWTLGEKVVKSGVFPMPYLRSLEDPNAEGNYDPRDPLRGVGQPATMDEYANLPLSRRADNGGVHINSGITNHAAYLVAQALGREKTEQIYYRTLTQYLTPNSDFLDAANASVRAATDLYGQTEADAVRQAFAQVGINAGGADTSPTPPSTSTTPSTGDNTPEQSPTQVPAGCTDVIVSGGFESDNGWTEVVQGSTALIDTELPHSGDRSVWLGGTDLEPVQQIYQDVKLPANATSIQLNYYRLIHEETSGLLGFLSGDANFSVLLSDPDTDNAVTVEQQASSSGDDSWHEVTADLSQLAGRTVRLMFAAENPRGNISSFFVDDVAIVVCTTGESPSTPPVQTQGDVYIQGNVVDSSTGNGVYGAQVFILQPGTTASAAAADGSITAKEVLTYGTSDQSGFYRVSASVPRGQQYSVIVIANGYRSIVSDDGVEITSSDPNPVTLDVTLRRGR